MTKRLWIILVAVVCGATALRLAQLTVPSLWVDEANGVLIASRPLPVIFDKLAADSSPPLFYLLLHAWIAAFGDSEWALRSLSILFSAALVGATFLVGVRQRSPAVGIVAAIYLAVSPSQVFYSQQARMYTLLPLLALLATGLLIRLLGNPGKRQGLAYGVAALAVVMVHNFGLFMLPAHAVLVLLAGRSQRHTVAVGIAVAVVLVGYSPWLPTFLEQLRQTDHYAWFWRDWSREGALGMVWNSISSLSPAAGYVPYNGLRQIELGPVPAWVCLLLAGFGAYRSVRRWRQDQCKVADVWVVVLYSMPLLASLVTSIALRPNLVAGRVDQMLLPFWALLVAVGIVELSVLGIWKTRRLVVASLLTGAVAATGLLTTATFYEDRRAELAGDDRECAQKLRQLLRPGDAVVFTSLSRAAIEYYLRRPGGPDLSALRLINFPRDTANHLGSQNDARLLLTTGYLRKEAEEIIANLQRQVTSGRVYEVMVMPRNKSDYPVWRVNQPLRSVTERGAARDVRRHGIYRQAGTGLRLLLVSFRF